MEEKLTTEEQTTLDWIASEGKPVYVRRARLLLLWDQGLAPKHIGPQVGLSFGRVYYWLRAFRERRMDVFPADLLAAAPALPPSFPSHGEETEGEEAPSETSIEAPHPEPLEAEPEGIKTEKSEITLEELCQRYDVDMAHARTVADHALALFDHLTPFHGLPSERRPLLETAALVHNVGLETDPNRHHKSGRDILLAHPLAELDEEERLIVALTTFLHRKRITPKKLDKKLSQPAFADLSESVQSEALTLAALVRLADGLDYTQTGSSELGEVRPRDGVVEIEVTGPYAAIDAVRAQKKSDLWRLLFETGLQFTPTQAALSTSSYAEGKQPSELTVSAAPEKPPEHPGLLADDTMVEAARKTFYFHFQRMLYHEPGTRLGKDIEELHDMRVATRRMRAAFRVFGDHLDMKQLKPIRKGLRRTGQVLGNVRDLDVFWDKTQRYLDALPPGQQGDLDPLREVWETEREKARAEMLAYLDGDRYARFKERFAELLQMPGAGALPALTKKGEAVPHRLKHVVPVAVYQRLAAIQAYDEWVTKPDVPLERLHRLRIAAKRLRYTLEFFEEVLGPQTEDLIKEMKKLQDHLGDLQDAVVASELLRDFLTWGTWGHAKGKKVSLPTEPIVAPGVAAYLAARQTEIQHLLETFPQVWTYFQSPEFKQTVAVAVAPL
jgi:CHAD domain-containing protein